MTNSIIPSKIVVYPGNATDDPKSHTKQLDYDSVGDSFKAMAISGKQDDAVQQDQDVPDSWEELYDDDEQQQQQSGDYYYSDEDDDYYYEQQSGDYYSDGHEHYHEYGYDYGYDYDYSHGDDYGNDYYYLQQRRIKDTLSYKSDDYLEDHGSDDDVASGDGDNSTPTAPDSTSSDDD